MLCCLLFDVVILPIVVTASGGVVYSDQFGSEIDRLSALIDKLEGKVPGHVQYILVCNITTLLVVRTVTF